MKKNGIRVLAALLMAFLMLFGDLTVLAIGSGIAAPMAATITASTASAEKTTVSTSVVETASTASAARTASSASASKKTPTVSAAVGATPTPVPEGPITDPQGIADWLFSHDMTLPDNFITKREARALGWDPSWNYVGDVAPGMSIGGDWFDNYEGKLPKGWGVYYWEADCYYKGKKRNAHRVIYSSEGRVWYTGDHYNTFTELFPSTP